MTITAEHREVVSACVRSIFRDSARQLMNNDTRLAYSLSPIIKWQELLQLEKALRELPVRICLMSKEGAMQLVILSPSFDNHSLYAAPKLLSRAIRAVLRETLANLTDEQRSAMLSLTMRVQGLRSTDGGVMTEGISFKPNEDSVTLVCRFGTNRLLDISRITRVFASYTVDGVFAVSSVSDSETKGGISAEGMVCSKAGLLPLVLYAQLAHESLCAPKPITGKRVTIEDNPKRDVRKRGVLSLFGF